MFLHSLNNDLPKMFLYNHFWPAAVMMNYVSLQSQVTLIVKEPDPTKDGFVQPTRQSGLMLMPSHLSISRLIMEAIV